MYRKKHVEFPENTPQSFHAVGEPVTRVGIEGNVTGGLKLTEDYAFNGLTHLTMVRSPHHHAKIVSMDLSGAEATPGFIRALTAKDVPNNIITPMQLIGIGPKDERIIAQDVVRYKGEGLAAIIAETPEAAAEAASKVKVEYEELPAVFDVEEALKDDAPIITLHGKNYFPYEDHHCRRIRFGDVEQGFAEADVIVEQRYDTGPVEHVPMEVTGTICEPTADGRFNVYTNTQGLFFILALSSYVCDIPPHKLRFLGGVTGGGFGGKVDGVTEYLAILGAHLTGRPVKYFYSRQEEMQISSTRAGWRFYIKDGVKNDGRIVARKLVGYANCGAYNRLVNYGVTKGAAHVPGPYTIPNVYADMHCVYTNRQPASAMRGFGVTMMDFAIESQMDIIAEKIGVDPWRLRLINAYKDGDMKAHRKEAEGTALIEVIQETAAAIGYDLPEDLKALKSYA
ncbi:MAG: molybdopterin cofactor-binding domain-containing protein [Pseudomonadota bacterium]